MESNSKLCDGEEGGETLSTLSPASDDSTDEDTSEMHLNSLSIIDDAEEDDDYEKKAPPTSSASLPVASTIALCMCTLTHSYLLISVFPYSGFMAIELLPSVDEENAGSYAGFIASSFMLGRSLTSYAWGKIADSYGRTTVLYISLLLSGLFTLLFGTSRTFTCAIVFRGLLGVSNGIIGTAKTVVSELSQDNERKETKMIGLVMGMWGWGFLVSPGLSGALAEPVRQYPNAAWVQHFEGLLTKFPFVLPNIVGAIFCLSSLIAVKLCVHETLLSKKRRRLTLTSCWSYIRACACRRRSSRNSDGEEVLPMKNVQIEEAAPDEDAPRRVEVIRDARLKHGESCLMLSTTKRPLSIEKDQQTQYRRDDSDETTTADATMASLWSRPDTRIHLIVYWIFSFVMSCIDESFPLFCLSKQGGLGLSEASIGKILSGSGIIFAVCQYFVYTFIVNRYGLYGSIKIGLALLVPLILLIPFSRFVQGGIGTEGEAAWLTFLYLSLLMAAVRICGLVAFSSITVTTNRTVPASHRGTMNGLSMLGGSASKGIGPVFAGCLVSFCFSSLVFSARVGAFVIFTTVSMFACIVAIPSITILEQSYDPCPENDENGNEQ